MIVELTKISIGLAVLLGGWLCVDLFWQRTFGSSGRRTGCRGCGCSTPCSSQGEEPDTSNPGEQ